MVTRSDQLGSSAVPVRCGRGAKAVMTGGALGWVAVPAPALAPAPVSASVPVSVPLPAPVLFSVSVPDPVPGAVAAAGSAVAGAAPEGAGASGSAAAAGGTGVFSGRVSGMMGCLEDDGKGSGSRDERNRPGAGRSRGAVWRPGGGALCCTAPAGWPGRPLCREQTPAEGDPCREQSFQRANRAGGRSLDRGRRCPGGVGRLRWERGAAFRGRSGRRPLRAGR